MITRTIPRITRCNVRTERSWPKSCRVVRLSVSAPLAYLIFLLQVTVGPLEAQAIRTIPAPGELVDVGGVKMHILCKGRGSPTVIISAGAGQWSTAWWEIQERLASHRRVCTYDRAGFGWSEGGTTPRTADNMVVELHELLVNARVEPPYLLVGHSFGGYVVRRFAHRYRGEVAGVALVESGHEDMWTQQPDSVLSVIDRLTDELGIVEGMVRSGTLRGSSLPPHPYFDKSPEFRAVYEAELTSIEHYEALIAIMSDIHTSAAQVGSARILGALPLVVVSASNSYDAFPDAGFPLEEANEAWMALQHDLLSLSPNVEHVVSSTGTHEINWTEPDLVIGAIAEKAQVAQLPGVLPGSSTPEVDSLLRVLERAYDGMDVSGFVSLFTDDFVQHDVPRRVTVIGKDAWTTQTSQLNALHRVMSRTHHGRIQVGNLVVAEVQWTGTVRGAALGSPTDRRYNYTGIVIMELEDGLIRRQLIYGDAPTLSAQLRLER